MENLTGQSLKGYELLDRIGSGGFGAVYRAYQSTLGREVAVKVILPHFADRPDFIRRFEAEAQLVARLEHLHIVPLYDYWREPGGGYLVMRWMRGGNLKDALRKGTFDLEPAALLLDQITAGLSAAHKAEIVHRDLKPSNVLLDEEGNAYLADFGIALDLRRGEGNEKNGEAALGSPAYLAPEQIHGEAATPQTDIYGLGVILYEMLNGVHPFPDLNTVELLYSQINEPLPPLTTLANSVADEVNSVIRRATAKDPRRRFDDALALAAAFRKAAGLREREAEELVELLTEREKEVLELIADGLTNRQIAQALYVEHSTVKWYIRQIYSKLGVRSRRQAIARAREMAAGVSVPPTTDGRLAARETASRPPVNPYKGLRPFDAADRDDFFGRETLLDRLLDRLSLPDVSQRPEATPGTGRFLAVVGPSGSGKSSLVHAGLIPALWDGRLPGSQRWFVVDFTPGARPLDELEVALIRVAADQAGNLHEQLLRDANGLLRVAQLILPRDESELMLVIDQFEELFSLVEDEAERGFFLDLLTTAVCDSRSRVRLILSLRADYYDRPLHYAAFGELLRRNMETVLPLKAQELEQAIVHPAEAAGVTYEPGLAATIIDDVLYQPGALPLLQYALTELFEKREGLLLTHAAYAAIGGATGALAQRAEELFLEEDQAGRELVRQLFLRLITIGQDEEVLPDTRRRVPHTELLALSDDEDLVDEVIDIFAAYRLLTLDHDPASRRPTVEVAHDALLREWDRLRRWLDESRTDLRQRRQLGRAAGEWRRAGEEPSFLLRGTRLAQFEAWSETTDLALTGTERDYMQTSAALRDERAAAEVARQAREAKLEERARWVLGALALVFLIAATVSGWLALSANRNLARSESQRLAAEANNVLQRAGSPELAGLLALQALNIHDTAQADLALQRAAAAYVDSEVIELPANADNPAVTADNRYLHFMHPGPDAEHWVVAELWDLQALKRLWLTSDYVIFGRPNASRSLTAGASALVAPETDGSRLALLDVESGAHILTFEGNLSPIVWYQLSADGTLLIAGAEDGSVHLWDAESGAQIRRFHVGDTGYARFERDLVVTVSPDSRRAVASADGLAHVWDIESGEEVYRFEHEKEDAYPAQFADNGRLMLAAYEPAISLWDLSTGQEVDHNLPPGVDSILSPDGRLFAQAHAGVLGQDVVLWDVATGRELHRLTGHSDGARPLAFLEDGRALITWGFEGTVRSWDVATGREVRVLAGHTDAIAGAALSPDERYLVTAGQDATVRVWDLRHDPFDDVRHLFQLSTDGRIALTADAETGTAMLVAGDSFAALHHLDFAPDPFSDGATASTLFTSDGQMVLGVKDDNSIVVYDVASGQLIAEHDDRRYVDAVFVPGSRHIFASGNEGAYLLDAESGEQLRLFPTPASLLGTPLGELVGVSSDGRYGAMTLWTIDPRAFYIFVWNLETDNLEFEWNHLSDHVTSFAFSEDSRLFAWGGLENTVHVRDLQSGQDVARLSHLDSIYGIAFSSDNRYLAASTGGDGVILWDLESEQVVRRFFAGASQAGFVRFVEDDQFVLYAHLFDGRIERQPVVQERLNDSLCARLQRDLTATERQHYGLDNSPTCPQFQKSPS